MGLTPYQRGYREADEALRGIRPAREPRVDPALWPFFAAALLTLAIVAAFLLAVGVW